MVISPENALINHPSSFYGRKQQKELLLKNFFSKCRKKIGSEFTIKPKCYNNYEWTWKYSILPTPIKSHREFRGPCKKDIQTIDHLIYQCEKLKYEKEY
jgi:hypothetical protein